MSRGFQPVTWPKSLSRSSVIEEGFVMINICPKNFLEVIWNWLYLKGKLDANLKSIPTRLFLRVVRVEYLKRGPAFQRLQHKS